MITGIGIALPETELTNADLETRLGLSSGWIEGRTGIRSRRIASKDDTAASLGARASMQALADAGVQPVGIDLVICATITPQWRFPATACVIQAELGTSSAAFDLNAGCSGFLYALAQADAAVRAGTTKRALVVGSEVMSGITDYNDPKTAILFGDGAGAVVVEQCEDGTSLGPFQLFSDGSRPELLYVPRETELIHMEGREVYRAAVDAMSCSVMDLLVAAGMNISDIDLLVAHQANQRILDAVAARLGLGESVAFSNIARYGNTSAASIPIALFEARSQGRLNEGDRLVLTAFGAGFTWGAGLVRWTATRSGERPRIAVGAAGV
ncbi:MAG TPA: beta-ketoacyl-ACP synthase III [Actinomycetota bacterium]|nr:beta-ketoacyl-ACP synthase III [Actinomycetota bacterium]